jgi:hypothetical protein
MAREGAASGALYHRVGIWLLGAVLLAALLVPSAAKAGQFTRAFTDDIWFTNGPSGDAQWVARTRATGAKLVLLELDWASVEPNAPANSAAATNPAAPQFRFNTMDQRIKEFAGTGMTVALLVTDAPQWAEGPGGSADLRGRGAWEPNAAAFGQFAAALARRYSGSYPDLSSLGHFLPHVGYYQAWAEANFQIHLAPQWVEVGGKLEPNAPSLYRGMLNAFYNGIKSVNSSDFVITTGFGPYGDSPGVCSVGEVGSGCRMHPAEFARDLLCLNSSLRKQSCPNPAHFDALAVDPYEVGSPLTHAYNKDDVSAPDLARLTKPLNRAVSQGTALPKAHKQLWVTEFSYESRPPNPNAVKLMTQAHWLEEAFYEFWSEGASTAVWYLVGDQPGTDYNVVYKSGVYFNDGQPKPALTAYRFPFVVRPYGSAARAWGIAPIGGRVAVQHKKGRKWRTLFQARASAGGVFTHRVSGSLRGKFRAKVGSQTSLVWSR